MSSGAKQNHAWRRFSLRALWLAVTITAVALGVISGHHRVKLREREVLKALSSYDVRPRVIYDYQWDSKEEKEITPSPSPPWPAWIRNLLGDDYFANVHVMYFDSSWEGYPDSHLLQLKAFPELKVLYLRRTEFSDEALRAIESVAHLEYLDLAYAKYSDSSLESLAGLSQLRKLSLNATKVTDDGLVHLKGLKQLEALDIAHTRVTDAGLIHLKGLVSLKILILSEKVTGAGLGHLAGLTQLERLSVSDLITDSDLVHLKGLKNLKRIDAGPNVTSKGWSDLKKSLPNLAIDWH